MKGTIKELLSQKISLNGIVLKPVDLQIILNHAPTCKKVNSVKTSSGKGKPAWIWEIGSSPEWEFTFGQHHQSEIQEEEYDDEPITVVNTIEYDQ